MKAAASEPGHCASCKLLPAVEGSVMCHGCRNHARRLVAQAMGTQRDGEVVRGVTGSGMPIGRSLP